MKEDEPRSMGGPPSPPLKAPDEEPAGAGAPKPTDDVGVERGARKAIPAAGDYRGPSGGAPLLLFSREDDHQVQSQ